MRVISRASLRRRPSRVVLSIPQPHQHFPAKAVAMSIRVSCSCGQQFMAQPHLAGQQVPCPRCNKPLSIPAAGGEAVAAGRVVTCACGKSFMAPPHLWGQRLPCPTCGQPIDIPAATGTAAADQGSSASKPDAAEAQPAARRQQSPVSSSVRPAKAKAPAARPAAKTPAASIGAAAAAKPGLLDQPEAIPAELDQPGLGQSDLVWDDALASPDLSIPLDAAYGPPAAVRHAPSETIQPMTMYAIWAGVAAVSLLVLTILGHIIWNAFADDEPAAAETQPPPAAEAAADPK